MHMQGRRRAEGVVLHQPRRHRRRLLLHLAQRGHGGYRVQQALIGATQLCLEDVSLPNPLHRTSLMKGHGHLLLYQIGEHDTRILMDVKNPLPSDLKVSRLCGLDLPPVRC